MEAYHNDVFYVLIGGNTTSDFISDLIPEAVKKLLRTEKERE